MSVWDNYEARINARGNTEREMSKRREMRYISTKIVDSLSYYVAIIEGEEREVSIINSDNLNQKKICSMPGEDLPLGGLVEWMGNHWLITEKDASNEMYTRAVMLQCNHILKWVDNDNVIHEQWCIVEDGTKYLTGEYEDRQFVVTRGDSRIAITIARNEHTAKLTRDNRFIIDDPDSPVPLAYLLTKPLKVGGVFNNEGVYKFVLQEVVTTDNDNFELGIADYYLHFPKDQPNSVDRYEIDPDILKTPEGKGVWL